MGDLVGRDDEVDAVVRYLAMRTDAVVTITGLPGVGRSAFAAEVTRRLAVMGVVASAHLTTARAPLGVDGEHVVRLAPLALPFAVELFVRRARHADVAFEADADDLAAVTELCRRLDGIPLAIERAAAMVAVMKPPAMVDLARQRGAWDLVGLDLSDEFGRAIGHLDDAQLRVLLALATFADDATVDAIHTVADGCSVSETIEVLGSLMVADLVRIEATGVRYSVMTSAADLLQLQLDTPLGCELRDRHAEWVASRARARRAEARTAPMDACVANDDVNLADDLKALDWVRERSSADDVLRLAVDLTHDFVLCGNPEAGRAMLLESLAFAGGATDARIRAEAHLAIVRFAWEGTAALDVAGVGRHLREARGLADESGDRRLLFKVLNAACERHIFVGAFEDAHEVVQSGLALCEPGADDRTRANFLGWKAIALHQANRPSDAEPVIWSAIGLALPLGDRVLADRTCVIYWGLPDAARKHDAEVPSLTELIELARRAGDARGEGWLLTIAMGAAIDHDDMPGAVAACRSAIELSRRAGNAPLGRHVLAVAMRLAAYSGRWETTALLEGVLSRDAAVVTARIPPHSLAALREATARAREMLGETRRQGLIASGHRMTYPEALAACDAFLDDLAAAIVTPLADADGATRVADDAEPILINTLTPRERDVLAQLVLGRPNKEIAQHLGLRDKTVMHHCAAIYRKLGVSGRAGAVVVALRAEAR